MKTWEIGVSTSRVARKCIYTSLVRRGSRFTRFAGSTCSSIQKTTKSSKGHLAPLSDDDLERLKVRIGELVNETKYLRMAELTEL
jgi:hypothetical protein